MKSYFVAFGDQRRGPFTLEQLGTEAVSLTSETLVWTRGMAEWAAASSVAELKPLLAFGSNEPPPYRPAAEPTYVATPSPSHPVPNWIVSYAIKVTPGLWLVQRLLNLVDIINEPNKSDAAGDAVAMTIWGVVSLLLVGIIFVGALRVRASQPRPLLLRVGLSINVMLSVALFAIALTAICVVLARGQSGQPPSGSTVGNAAEIVGAMLCLLNTAVDAIVLFKLNRPEK